MIFIFLNKLIYEAVEVRGSFHAGRGALQTPVRGHFAGLRSLY